MFVHIFFSFKNPRMATAATVSLTAVILHQDLYASFMKRIQVVIAVQPMTTTRMVIVNVTVVIHMTI